MIQSLTDGEKLFGVYRGTVLKHLPHGRCKIYIPAAYSEYYADKPDLLPSAEQAAPLFAGVNKGNGVFSYPNIGAIVLCMFLNGDANFPIYIAATLGGENAFGQYSIIKHDLKEENGEEIDSIEPVSERHLVTSGKTHIEWYEKGKLSAIVEDPIRTICSVDYDTWELGADNIAADDKYKSKLSNDNVWKIRDNKLSNIDCQLVMDNDGKTHGKLSTSTHWYDIIDQTDDKKGIFKKGTISTDNWHVMHNDGEIQFGTLSSKALQQKSDDQTDTSHISVNNIYTLHQPGIMDHEVKQIALIDSINQNGFDKKKLSSWTHEHHDVSSNAIISAYREKQNNFIDDHQSINLTSYLSNSFCLLSDSCFGISSNTDEKIISADKNTNSSQTKLDKLSSILSNGLGNAAFQNVSSLNNIKIDQSGSKNEMNKLSTQMLFSKNGEISVATCLDINSVNQQGATITQKTNAWSKDILNVDGLHSEAAYWYNLYSANGSTQITENNFQLESNSKNIATLNEKVACTKKVDGSPIIDFAYAKMLNAQTSTVDITIEDKVSQNSSGFMNGLSKGQTVLYIQSKSTGMKCTITMNAYGQMTIDTTDKLDISTTNSVTVTSPQITMNGTTTINGATTVNSTLHVTGSTTIDSSAKIAGDANIGGKSFLGHTHLGNLGSPTSPPV